MPELKKPVGRPKSQEKRQQIICHAGQLILQSGYSKTSMETIAKASGVSKQTLYSHFTNKEQILRAVIKSKVEQYQLDEQMFVNDEVSLEQGLSIISDHFIQLLHDEEVVAMHRVVAGELSVSPEVAIILYELGPKTVISAVSHFLTPFVKIAQPELEEEKLSEVSKHYALLFLNMLKGSYHMESLLGLDFALTKEAQQQHAKQCVSHCLTLLKFELNIT